MSEPLKVGVIGCGVISGIYAHNMPGFRDVEMVACADMNEAAASRLGNAYGLRVAAVDDLLNDPEIDIVLNLTVPVAHATVTRTALNAGKHVYSEKPLGISIDEGKELVDLAAAKGLRVGVAPDTVLGAGHRISRELIDSGKVGTILSGTCFMLSPGMESWHPNPAFFFQRGGGPVLDVGPYYIASLVQLLGPITAVAGVEATGKAERVCGADGPNKDVAFKVEVPTTALALLRFGNGAHIFLALSWDVQAHGHRPMELYGTTATIRPPDPNFFGGDIEVGTGKDNWTVIKSDDRVFGAPNWPVDNPTRTNFRGLGIAEMAAAIKAGRPHRTSDRLGLHVLEVAEAIEQSARQGGFVEVASGAERPAHLTEEEAQALLA